MSSLYSKRIQMTSNCLSRTWKKLCRLVRRPSDRISRQWEVIFKSWLELWIQPISCFNLGRLNHFKNHNLQLVQERLSTKQSATRWDFQWAPSTSAWAPTPKEHCTGPVLGADRATLLPPILSSVLQSCRCSSLPPQDLVPDALHRWPHQNLHLQSVWLPTKYLWYKK